MSPSSFFCPGILTPASHRFLVICVSILGGPPTLRDVQVSGPTSPTHHCYHPPPTMCSLFSNKFIHLFIWGFFGRCCKGFSLVAESGDYSLVAVQGLLLVVASLVAEHGL